MVTSRRTLLLSSMDNYQLKTQKTTLSRNTIHLDSNNMITLQTHLTPQPHTQPIDTTTTVVLLLATLMQLCELGIG